MGGKRKKKKSLASKLARMGEEERARYLQRRAEQEEEARRRREQLLSAFMKNKIKREDAFARLNLAKINQQWHQLLRLNKCQEMRSNVEHLKKSFDRALDHKNRMIGKLLEELQMAEDQYAHNFQRHSLHIDQILDDHQKQMDRLHHHHHQELAEMVEIGAKERTEIALRAVEEENHLRTLIYGQEETARARMGALLARQRSRAIEDDAERRERLGLMKRSREAASAAIWEQMAAVVGAYVRRTDRRRLQLAEMRRADAESAAEIVANQERIKRQEAEVRQLAERLQRLRRRREAQLALLAEVERLHRSTFLGAKRALHRELLLDEQRLRFFTAKATQAVEVLENCTQKGQRVVSLYENCRKMTMGEKQNEKCKPHVDNGMEDDHSIDFNFENLGKLTKFWMVYNQVEIDFCCLKKQKSVLLSENRRLKEMVRAVLEAVTLTAGNIPISKATTRKTAKSAPPLRRIVF